MWIFTVLLGVVATVALVAAAVALMFLNLWIQARASGIRVGIWRLLLMRLRQVDPNLLIINMISLVKSGIHASLDELEAHVLAGGSLKSVVDALIAAEKAGLEVDFRQIAAIDLAGRDVGDAVKSRVNPKVLQCPPAGSGQEAISGVCHDGIRLGVKARVTVRTQLDRLVGGAGEDTIIARVGEGIVAAVGRAASHKDILESPERISQYLLEHGLDSGTCFEILSVDIASLDVLDNVGAKLRSDQADSDKRIAQAKAEIRRTAAVAAYHEMTARSTENQSRVVAAKATLPRAVSAAFQEVNLGRTRALAPTQHDAMRWRRPLPQG